LAGCLGSAPSSLAELPASQLVISANTGSTATGAYYGLGSLQLGIGAQTEECPIVRRGVTATINGMTVGTFSTGGSYYSYDAKAEVCRSPGFFVTDNHRASRPDAPSKIPDLTQPESHVVISDGETTWRAVFQSLCSARSVTRISPTTASVRAGENVVLQWAPATDRITPSVLIVRLEGSEQIAARVEGPKVVGSTLTFTMPALATSGRYTFEPMGSPAFRPGVASCEGPSVCEAACHDIDVAPALVEFVR
jgi:hypothetical protein